MIILQRHQGRHYVDLRKNRFDGDLGIVPLEFRKVRASTCVYRGVHLPYNPPTPQPNNPTHIFLPYPLINKQTQQDTGTLREVENARLAHALVHEEQHGPPRYGSGGAGGYGGQGGGGDPRNQPLVKERQFY